MTEWRNRGAVRGAEGGIRARNERNILRAAQDVFSRKGFEGTTVADIARESGLPKANVYYYFGSKQGVYRAAIDSLLKEWNDAFDHIAEDREPAEAIEAYVRAKLAYSRQNKAASKMFANENIRGSTFLSRQERKSIRDVTRQKARVVEAWIKAGKLAAVDPTHFFIVLWASTQFYADFDSVILNVMGKRRLTESDFDAAADTITRLVTSGCLARLELRE